MKHGKKILGLLMALLLALLPLTASAAAGDEVIVLGANLSDSQKAKVLDLLDIHSLEGKTVVTVSIDEERALVGNLVDSSVIGSRSISSARITLAEEGTGISVTTHNISFITPTMYASALATAGVADATVIIAAPTEVSGTAALAGIFKAYEQTTELTLDDAAKMLASEELLLSGELGEFVGSDEAVQLIAQLKQMVLDNGWDNEETIRPAVVQAIADMGISLTDEQIDQVVALLLKFCSLDMDAEEISKQLQTIVKAAQTAAQTGQKLTDFFAKVGDVFQSIGSWFKGLFSKKS